MAKDSFSSYSPAVGFAFFMGAIILGMFFIHPAYLGVSCALSAVYYLCLKDSGGWRLIGILLIVLVAISVINPVFNTLGDTVLFTWPGGRRYTLEALYYGMATGAMFFSILLWFASYNIVMTSDKFIYLFGRLIPAISLILTMVLRLVPIFKRKLAAISGARKCIGLGAGQGRRAQLEHAGTAVMALMGWALEGSVETSDAMRSRGYGLPSRTSFASYRFGKRDSAMLAVMAALAAAVIYCAVMGAAMAGYVPKVYLPGMTVYSYIGIAAYVALLALPSALHLLEDIQWRILRSKT